MKLLLPFIFTFSSLLFTSNLQAQDALFTQFFANPLFVNPAMAGTSSTDENAAGRAVLHYRNQWPGLPGAYRSLTGSWDQGFDAVHGGFGAQFVYNSYASGLITDTELRAFYSLRSELDQDGKHLLYAGIQLASTSRSINFGRLKFGDQLATLMGMDSTFTNAPMNSAIGYVNPAIGVLLSNENYNIGIAVHNLLEPNTSFFANPEVILPRRYTLHAAFNLPLDETGDILLQPTFLYARQRNISQLIASAQMQWRLIDAGMGVVFSNAYNMQTTSGMANIGFRIRQFRMIYSFDVKISVGQSAIPSSHELSLCYRWNTKQEKRCGSKLIF